MGVATGPDREGPAGTRPVTGLRSSGLYPGGGIHSQGQARSDGRSEVRGGAPGRRQRGFVEPGPVRCPKTGERCPVGPGTPPGEDSPV